MKFVLTFILSFVLVGCDSNVSSIGSAAPSGTFVSSDGKVTLTFNSGRVKAVTSIGTQEGAFIIDDGGAKWQFPGGGMPMSLKRDKDGTWVSITGTKYVQK